MFIEAFLVCSIFAAPVPIPKIHEIDVEKVQQFALTQNPCSSYYPYVITKTQKQYEMKYSGQFSVLFFKHDIQGPIWCYKNNITLYQTVDYKYSDILYITHIIPIKKYKESNLIYECIIYVDENKYDSWYLIKLK